MRELQNFRFSFLVIAFLICNVVVLPFDFFLQLKISIPFWSFYLLEIAFIFLILFAAFPKISIDSILQIAVVFLIFTSLCFLLQGFLPFDAKHKILSFIVNEEQNSIKIVINLIALVALHLTTCFLFASELLRNTDELKNFEEQVASEPAQPGPGETLQYQRDTSYGQYHDTFNPEQIEHLNEIRRAGYEDFEKQAQVDAMNTEEVDMKEEVDSLFNLYLDDYENNVEEDAKTLSNMEQILLDNLKDGVSGAMCLDANGEELHAQVFRWEGFNKFDLLELYKANSELTRSLDEGALCQMIFCDNEHWYLIAKYRGNYLLLQSEEKTPDLLIENGFYLVQAIKEFA